MSESKPPLATPAPPLPRQVPRAVWIGGGIAAIVFLAVLCGGAAALVSLLLGRAGLGPGSAPIVGKWELVGDPLRAKFEFNRDGTGTIETPDLLGAIIKATPDAPKQVPTKRAPFQWHIKPEKTPVLVIDPGVSGPFQIDGDTLTITAQDGIPLVLRRIK